MRICAFVALLFIGCYSFDLKENCLKCICARNDCDGRVGKNCTDGVCGPFYISKKYYAECGSPVASGSVEPGYEACAKEMDCSSRCVTAFLAKYADSCTYPRQPRCRDYSRMHWSGSKTGCRTLDKVIQEETVQLSNIPVQECCDKLGGCD